jgi:uncharacterized protein YbjT (DUF2867 family)
MSRRQQSTCQSKTVVHTQEKGRMTVAVSGATGFIGSAVVRRLLADGRKVRALVEPGAPLTNLEGLDVERVTADVCDHEAMVRALEGAKAYYHLADLARQRRGDDDLAPRRQDRRRREGRLHRVDRGDRPP